MSLFLERCRYQTLDFAIQALDTHSSEWDNRVDEIRKVLGAPNNPLLFPPHFLKAAFPKIGGEFAILTKADKLTGIIFLFPQKGNKYIGRVHMAPNTGEMAISLETKQAFAGAGVDVALYDPETVHVYTPTHNLFKDSLGIGRPLPTETVQIRSVQKTVWGSEDDYLYPADIHSLEFGLATSLVARDKEKVIGFLFGFYKVDHNPLPESLQGRYGSTQRVESQLMGFLPEYRSKGLGFELKKYQALQAREEGIDIVNWTVDPLQFANSALNFGKLRGIAFDFYPNYYQFRNVLNQVAASRFAITWFVNSERVNKVLESEEEPRTEIIDLSKRGDIVRVNEAFEKVNLNVENKAMLAIEVPSDWTKVQKENLEQAIQWRETTDSIFAHYLGTKGKGYAIVDVATEVVGSDKKCFLLAQKLEDISGI